MPINTSDLTQVPDDALVYYRTVQVAPFRTLIESLAQILKEVTFVVTRDAMTMCEEDPMKNCLVVATLYDFEHKYVDPSVTEVELGFEIGTLHRKLRTQNPDLLVIYVSKTEPNLIRFYTHSAAKNMTMNNFAVRLDLNKKRIVMKRQPHMTRYAVLPHNDFQKSIKELASLNNEIVIRSEGEKLILATDVPLGNGSTERVAAQYEPIRNNLWWKYVSYSEGPNDFENCYPIRYLDKFCKNALDKYVHIYLRENMALVLRYMIGRLGTVHFFLSKIDGRSKSEPRTKDIAPVADDPFEAPAPAPAPAPASGNGKRKRDESDPRSLLPKLQSARTGQPMAAAEVAEGAEVAQKKMMKTKPFKKPRVIKRSRPTETNAPAFHTSKDTEEWESSGDELSSPPPPPSEPESESDFESDFESDSEETESTATECVY